jgi:hypothetical protein
MELLRLSMGAAAKHAGWPAGGALTCACPLAFRRIKIALRLPSWGLARDWGDAPLTRGTPVIVQVPGWSARAVPVLKPMAAVAGEGVCRAGQALVIHSEDSGPVDDAWRGEPLPSAVGQRARLITGL